MRLAEIPGGDELHADFKTQRADHHAATKPRCSRRHSPRSRPKEVPPGSRYPTGALLNLSTHHAKNAFCHVSVVPACSCMGQSGQTLQHPKQVSLILDPQTSIAYQKKSAASLFLGDHEVNPTCRPNPDLSTRLRQPKHLRRSFPAHPALQSKGQTGRSEDWVQAHCCPLVYGGQWPEGQAF